MATPTWPTGAPYRPLRTPWRIEARYRPPIKTEMEDGPTRQRRTGTARWSRFAYQIRMTPAQYAAADNFVVNDLADGAARFKMPVGRPYAAEPWPLKLCYLDAESWAASAAWVDGQECMLVTFTLNVLDW